MQLLGLPHLTLPVYPALATTMGARRIFLEGWAMRGLKDGSLQGVQGHSLTIFSQKMHKYFVYWEFSQHLQHKKHFTTFPGGRCPLACGRL